MIPSRRELEGRQSNEYATRRGTIQLIPSDRLSYDRQVLTTDVTILKQDPGTCSGTNQTTPEERITVAAKQSEWYDTRRGTIATTK
jgi:hypothetical protein